MSSHSWLRTDMSANRWQQTYFKNFVDISGDLYIRKGGISAGDNADKFTVDSNGDISANSVNIAGGPSVVSGVQIQSTSTAIYVKSNDKNRLVLGDKVINGANNNTIVAHNGNVGIGGVWTPAYTLDVNGSIHGDSLDINSNFTVDGTGVVSAASINGTLNTAAQPNITSVGTLSSLDVTNAVSADSLSATTLTGTLNTAAQPNITSVGTLSSLSVNGNLSIYDNHRGFFIDSRTGDSFFDYFSTFLGQGVKRTGNKAFEAISDGVNTGLSAIMMERTNIRFYTNIYSNQSSDLTLTHTDLQAKERMVINNAGNVGIGTTTPKNKLEVPVNSYYDGICVKSGDVRTIFGRADSTNAGSIQVFHSVPNATPTASSGKWHLSLQPLGGNVGIGTNNPGYTLDVNDQIRARGNGSAYVRLGSYGSGIAYVWGDDGTSTAELAIGHGVATEVMRLKNGNVGIGTTNPAYKLDIYEDTTDTENSIRYRCSAPSGVDSKSYMRLERDGYGGAIGGGLKQGSGGVLALATINNDDTITDRMTINKDGNVGIGTNNPGFLLDVYHPSQTLVNIGVGTGATNSSGSLQLIKGDNARIRTTGSDDLIFDTDSIERMRIKDTGNVGIGTTTPGKKLDVVGDIGFSGDLYKNGALFNPGSQWTTTGNDIYYNTGNVGIGNINPRATLHVYGNDGFTISPSGTGARTATIRLGSPYNSNHDAYCAKITSFNNSSNNYNADLRFWTSQGNNISATERMCILSNGNVGIGTASPGHKLDVIGNVQIEGSLYLKGTWIQSTNAGGGDIILQPRTASHNVIVNQGNLGIGTTTPSETLDVNGNVRIRGANLYIGNDPNDSLRFNHSQNSTTSYSYIDYNDNGSLYFRPTSLGSYNNYTMTLTYDGKVGIGTTSPATALQISSTSGLRLTNTVSKTNANDRIGYIDFNNGPTGAAIESCVNVTGANNNADLRFMTSQDYANTYVERMRIDKQGHVGIGTTTPDYDLTIISNNTDIADKPSHYYLTYSGIGGGSGYASVYTSVYADDSFVTNGHFFAWSDRRIKTNITDIDDDNALQQLRLIQPKTYEYIDKIHRTNQTVFGFIAQEVGEVMTNAMSTVKGIIPNIFESANVSKSDNDDYNIIIFTDFDTADLDASSNIIRVIGSNNAKHTVTISEVIDNKTIRVDTDLSEWMGAVDASNETVIRNEVQTYSQVILDASNNVVLENYDIEPIASMDASENVVGKMADLTGDNTIDSSGNYVDASGNTIAAINADGHYIDASGNYFDADGNFKDASGSLIGTYKASWKNVIIHGTSIFVYGQKINDLCTLNKDAIFTVATAALQEVDRQLQAEKAKTATLESQMADLLARVTALESA